MKYFFILLILFLFCCNSSKSVYSEIIEFENPYQFNSEIEGNINDDSNSFELQMAAQNYASKTDYYNALKYWDLAMGSKIFELSDQQMDSIKTLYKTERALEHILEEAKSHQIIIINESHHNSLHRAFAKSILPELFDLGYKNIGFETLGNGEYIDSMLIQRKYPVQGTGFYTKDPQFGDLVRTALNIGFNVFPYEQTNNTNGKLREIEQARNIQEQIEKHPDEKFLIYCGFDHVYEGIHETWEKAMAARLKEYTGIDPLTIDQITLSERSSPQLNHPILNALDVNQPSILINKLGKPQKKEYKERWTDLMILHPKTTSYNSRPNWLFEFGNKSVSIDLNALDITFPIMVLAYKKGEDITNAIPVDIFEVNQKTDSIVLALKGGAYTLVFVNEHNKALKLEMNVE